MKKIKKTLAIMLSMITLNLINSFNVGAVALNKSLLSDLVAVDTKGYEHKSVWSDNKMELFYNPERKQSNQYYCLDKFFDLSTGSMNYSLSEIYIYSYVYEFFKEDSCIFSDTATYGEDVNAPSDKEAELLVEYINNNYPDFEVHIGEVGEYNLQRNYKIEIVPDKELTEDEKWELTADIYNNLSCSPYHLTAESSISIDFSGDVNSDYSVNISDVLTVSAHINNNDKYPMEEQSIINGDVHEPGNGLNSSDAFMIQQYVTGVIESL